MAVDPLLRYLNHCVHQQDGFMPITLYVPGGIVSGELVSVVAYLDAMTTQLAGDPWQQQFRAASIDVRSRIDVDQTTGIPADHPALDYLHLRNIAVLTQETTISLPCWRGQIAIVSGWAFGRIVTSIGG